MLTLPTHDLFLFVFFAFWVLWWFGALRCTVHLATAPRNWLHHCVHHISPSPW